MSEHEVRANNEHSALVAASRPWAIGTAEVRR
jgi:hypothetical protein